MTVKQQPWQCDGCGKSGSVEYQPGAGLCEVAQGEVAQAISADHRMTSPACDAGWHEIRVVNMNYQRPA